MRTNVLLVFILPLRGFSTMKKGCRGQCVRAEDITTHEVKFYGIDLDFKGGRKLQGYLGFRRWQEFTFEKMCPIRAHFLERFAVVYAAILILRIANSIDYEEVIG